ncbi:MAG: FG-GAP repeat domain-containing protein [Candidatus Eiseniibacteriota bacterium]
MSTIVSCRPALGALIGLAALLVIAPPSQAQLGFTEFALSDTTLNSVPATDFWIASAAPADVDADGDLDLLIAGYYVVYATEADPEGLVEYRLTLYRNDGPANATTWNLTPIPVNPGTLLFGSADLAWGDYDNDGDPDVAVAGEGEMVLYRNDGGTLVATPTVFPAYNEDGDFTTMDQRSLSWADFDNDGDLDLLVPSVVSEFDWEPTVLLRNDGAGAGDAWTFTDATAGLPIAQNAVSSWADADQDGDLDLLLGNVSSFGNNFLETWRNDAGTLVRADTDLAFIRYGTADWGDPDADGDLDIVYCGNIDLPDKTGETVVRILVNDGAGGYTPLDVARDFFSDPGAPWLDFSAVTWADYDSDGDVDLLVSGLWLGDGEILGQAVVYRNDGGTLAPGSEPLPAPIAGNAGGAFAWFDVDGDGDLDYFVAGAYYVEGGNGLVEARTQLFRNDASVANASPLAPTGLASVINGADGVTLDWNASSDDSTPWSALTYELEVVAQGGGGARAGVAGGGPSPMRALPQPGNVSRNTSWALSGLAPGAYSWSVRALDSAFNGSAIAQGSFVIGGVAVPGPGELRPGAGLALSAPFPNPTRVGERATQFTLRLGQAGSVLVAAYDPGGRRVAVLHDGPLSAGEHRVSFDARDLASGTYFVRAIGPAGEAAQRVTIAR